MTHNIIYTPIYLDSEFLKSAEYWPGLSDLSNSGRYMLFRYNVYSPSGGLNDFIGAHNNLNCIKQIIRENEWLRREHLEIFDKKNNIVYEVRELKDYQDICSVAEREENQDIKTGDADVADD